MPNALHFKRNELPFIPCKAPGGETKIARVINGKISQNMGGGLEIAENIKVHWTTLYDEILFIHEGSMIVRTDQGEMECNVGDIIWLPEAARSITTSPGAAALTSTRSIPSTGPRATGWKSPERPWPAPPSEGGRHGLLYRRSLGRASCAD